MLDQKHFPFDHHVIGVENDPFLVGRLLLITEETRRVSVCLQSVKMKGTTIFRSQFDFQSIRWKDMIRFVFLSNSFLQSFLSDGFPVICTKE